MHTELHFSFLSRLLIREYEFISIHQKQLTRTLGVSYFVLKFVCVQLHQYQPLNSILQLKKPGTCMHCTHGSTQVEKSK